MTKKFYRSALFAILALGISLAWLKPTAAETDAIRVPSTPIAESVDFASLTLRDAWDMTEYSDVSQYINASGQANELSNPRVDAGVFSATAENDPKFWLLFPGYRTAIHTGKTGSRYPIRSNVYGCLQIALRAAAPIAAPGNLNAWWSDDDRLGENRGGVSGVRLAANQWVLYRIPFSDPGNPINGGTSWTSLATWQGLRVDLAADTGQNISGFEVDWARLTSCTRQNATINISGAVNGNYFWVRPQGATRNIRVSQLGTGNQGNYNLDTSGLAAGSYQVCTGSATNVNECSQGLLRIQARPIASFDKPSFWSGGDYASQAGNPWDFSDAADVPITYNIDTAENQNGLLYTVTRSGSPPGGRDAQVRLNGPVSADPRQFRYLTFRMHSSWVSNWQNVPRGMIVRWIWATQNESCVLVSHDIPFDIGWQTLTIDLWNGFSGAAEERSGSCGNMNTWLNTTSVARFRFDPNENVSGQTFTQNLDWIRLTRPDDVRQGNDFPIRMNILTPQAEVDTLTLYYTTDPVGNPTAHQIVRRSFSQLLSAEMPVEQSPAAPEETLDSVLFLPLIRNRPSFSINGSLVEYFWDTGNIPVGEYYICAVMATATANSTQCSEAPVKIIR